MHDFAHNLPCPTLYGTILDLLADAFATVDRLMTRWDTDAVRGCIKDIEGEG